MSPVSDVFLLGAGFSRAISPSMPLIADLGAIVRERLRDSERYRHALDLSGDMPDAHFEAWLSLLAEDQPHLTRAENLANRSFFVELLGNLASVMRGRVTATLRGSMPTWLGDLVQHWHERRATIVTLNYDHLVEATVDTLAIKLDWERPERLASPFLPPALVGFWNQAFGGSRMPRAESFQFLKLHGSLNWYWHPTSGGSFVDVRLGQRWAPDAHGINDEELRYRAAGMEPFIVPPLALKSNYFQQVQLREFWNRARGDLEIARTLYCVGCSLHPRTFPCARCSD